MMTEISPGIMHLAALAHAEFAKSSVDKNLTIIIAEAIATERERCAKVADYHAECSLSASHSEDDGSYYACGHIANDIRNPRPPAPPVSLDLDDLPF